MAAKKGESGTYRVLNAVFEVKNGRIEYIWKIVREGRDEYENPGHLYVYSTKRMEWDLIERNEYRYYKFSTIRSGMYAGRYMVN